MLDALETFLTTALGKGVIRAKDTPNFIANRIGIFSVLATMRHADALGLGYDVVDALTGPAIGRAKSATYRTGDVVGLDTLAHVVDDDARRACRTTRGMRCSTCRRSLAGLVAKGALGQKTRARLLPQVGQDDRGARPRDASVRAGAGRGGARGRGDRRAIRTRTSVSPSLRALGASAGAIPVGDLPRSLPLLRQSISRRSPTTRATSTSRCAGASAGSRARSRCGRRRGGARWPRWIARRHRRGPRASARAAAAWVGSTGDRRRRRRASRRSGAYSPARDAFVGRVDAARLSPAAFSRAGAATKRIDSGTTIFETDAVRFWHLRDDVGIVSFQDASSTRSATACSTACCARSTTPNATRGSRDLAAARAVFARREPRGDRARRSSAARGRPSKRASRSSSRRSQRLRYCLVPTVAAVRGMALGGSCEFILHCDRTVAALESYIGLVEAGVGLLPAGGGSKELALRAAADVQRGANGGQLDLFPFLRTYFQNVATATVSKSALEATRARATFAPPTPSCMHPHEVLHVGAWRRHARSHDAGYRPPLPARGVAGRRAGPASRR